VLEQVAFVILWGGRKIELGSQTMPIALLVSLIQKVQCFHPSGIRIPEVMGFIINDHQVWVRRDALAQRLARIQGTGARNRRSCPRIKVLFGSPAGLLLEQAVDISEV
jgi:hypothetical protein